MPAHSPRRPVLAIATLAAALALTLPDAPRAAAGAPKAVPGTQPSLADARAFIEEAETRLQELSIKSDRADWVQQNFITEDTEKIASDAKEALIAAVTDYALKARRFAGLRLPADVARKFELLRLSIELPAPNNPKERGELTDIGAWMESAYGKGKYCPPGTGAPGEPGGAAGPGCLDINNITRIMAESRDPQRLLDVWRDWHTISPPMRPKYQRLAELANKGAREMGFKDLGAMWRSNYDMTPEAFSAEVERLWKQVAPLYWSLHAYVRSQLVGANGDVRALTNPIWADQL